MSSNIADILKNYAAEAERELERIFAHEKNEAEQKIFDAMGYSVFAGGKRIRPAIMMLFCRLCGGDIKRVMPFAAALEMIHTYSLIHDDLPCMDDDDLRRGKPTNHKVFGEGMALLAGDGLLGLAFETMLSGNVGNKADITLEAARLIANYSGLGGMLTGQVSDVTGMPKDETSLVNMYSGKTSGLIKAAATVGALVGGGSDEQIKAAESYAENIGIAFQICDDVLDVVSTNEKLGKNVGSDSENGKLTFVTLFGAEGALERAAFYSEKARESVKYFDEGYLLDELAQYLLKRDK